MMSKRTAIVIVLPNDFVKLDYPADDCRCVFESYAWLPKDRVIVSQDVTTRQKEVAVAHALRNHPEYKETIYGIIRSHKLNQAAIEKTISEHNKRYG